MITVKRSTGSFALGGFVSNTVTLTVPGIILQMSPARLSQVSHGDRIEDGIDLWATQQVYLTHNTPQPGLSDLISYHGKDYRIVTVSDRSDNGYYRATALGTAGQ